MRSFDPRGGVCTPRVTHAVLLYILALLLGPSPASAADLGGVVVDPDGRPLPRVVLRVTGQAGDTDVFTDEAGRFRVQADAPCTIEASLAGFRPAAVPCASTPLRIELRLAPVEETVVVTATRTEAPASQVGVATSTIGPEEIARRQHPRVADLLRSTPGAMVVQTGAPGGVTGLFVRGGESTYNKVLLDGIPLNEPGGTFNFNNLSAENLERVEVVRGANSSLFGSDAMSSVVQLFTRRAAPGQKPAASAQIEGGSYGTLRASATAGGVARGWDYTIAAARLSSENRVPNSNFENTTLSANVGTTIGTRTSVRAVTRAEIGRTGTPGQTAYGRPDLDAYFDQHQVTGGVSFDQQTSRALRQRATYSLAATNQASVNLVADPPFTPSFGGRRSAFEWADFPYDTRNRLRRHFASYQADWRVAGSGRRGAHLLTLLADWNGERATLSNRTSGEATEAARDNVGASIQHQMVWRRLSASVGGRLERNSSFGVAAVPRVSAVYTVRQHAGRVGDTRVRAATGLGIKEPTILQSFSLSPFFRGNPDLRPERSRSVEAGIEQRLLADRVKLEATWFDNRYRNIIGLRTTRGFEAEYANIGLTRARGIEVAAEAAPHDTVRVRGGYTLVDSAIVESTSSFSRVFAAGNWAFRRPRHSGYVQGAWTWARLSTDLTGTFVGRFVDSDFASFTDPLLENPGWSLWDARASWQTTSRLTTFLAIDNLTGRDFQQPLGYLALRRATRVGVRVAF